MKKSFWALNCACSILCAIHFFSVPLAQAKDAPVKIGVIYGFTGAAQKWASAGKKGIELAVSEINQRGGIHGQPLEIIYEDNATNPRQSVTAYKKLVSVDKVSAIIASNWSILTNPLVPLSEQNRTVVIAPTVMDTSVEGESKHFFTMGNRIESIRKPVRQFFKHHPDIKKVSFLCWEDAWGRANLRIWEEEALAANVRILATICQGDYSNDFKVDVSQALRKSPDALFVGMYPERVAQRLHELKQALPIFTTNVAMEVVVDPAFSEELFQNMYFAYWPPSDKFLRSFKERFHEEPILEAHNHYEIIHSLAKALRAKGKGDLLPALQQVRYQGDAGLIDYSSRFVNHGQGTLVEIRGRSFVPVK